MVDDDVDIVHSDSLAYVAMADAPPLRGQDGIAFLSGRDLSNF